MKKLARRSLPSPENRSSNPTIFNVYLPRERKPLKVRVPWSASQAILFDKLELPRSFILSPSRFLTERQLKDMIASADADNSGTIDFDELLALMENNTVKNTYLDEMKKAFKHFDSDGNGFISPLELRKALLRMKIKLSKVEFVLMLRRVDTDQDGMISFKEFVVMMLTDAG